MRQGKITRIVQILTTLQSGKGFAANDLAELFCTSRRTIFRDLKELQAIGVPYRYDAKTARYTMDPEFFLPPIDLNLQEALSLLLLVHKTANQFQVPFKNSVLLAGLKIENNLPAGVRQYCNNALRSISAKLAAQAPTDLLDNSFSKLHIAIAKKQMVEMQYHSLFEGQLINLVLHPYHLLYNNRAWYVLGFSEPHKAVRTFKLNRIKQLQPLDKLFVDGETFDLYEHLGRAWSMIPEGRIYNIKLRFLPKVAHNVAEVQWHSSQQVRLCEDGSAIVEFRIDGLNEISWWLLGYGDQVQIMAPNALRKKIVETAKNIVRVNEQLVSREIMQSIKNDTA